MVKNIYQTALVNSIYFSGATFMLVWLAGFLFELLEKTHGRINLGSLIVLVLGLVLILFFLALTNIIFGEFSGKTKAGQRVLAVILFMAGSILLLGLLGILFWYPV